MNDTDPVDASVPGMTPDSGSLAGAAVQQGSCLLLGINGLKMLVPRNVVAEVLSHSLLKFAKDPVAGVDTIEWRGLRVPHLGSAMLGASAVALDAETRVAVFHGLKNPRLLPFYSFTISRSPRLLRVGDGDLEAIAGVDLHPAELMRIRLDQTEAFIPKVDYFENVLLGLMKRHVEG